MFNRDGMDYGPFSARDIEKMVEDGDLTPESEIIHYKTKAAAPLNQVPYFADFLVEKEKRDRAAAHRAEVERDTNQAIAQSRRRHIGPLVVAGVLLVAGLIGSWLLLRDPEMPTSGYPVTFFRDMSFPMVEPMKQRLASPVEFQAEAAGADRAVAASSPRRRSGRSPNGSANDAVIEAPVLDMSFETSGEGATRQLAPEDIEELKQAVTPGLIGCFQKEVAAVDGFSGGKVVFFVMPRGKVALSKVETNPPASGSLVSCVKSTVNSRKVRPYAGAIQIIEFPLHVSVN